MTSSPISLRHHSITDLPVEILAQIFSYVYPSWHFRYTQVHDNHPDPPSPQPSTNPWSIPTESTITSSTPPSLKLGTISTLHGLGLFSPLPSLAPLLTCRTLHHPASRALAASFTRQVHIASRMMWLEVHATYASIMAQARELVIASEYNNSYEMRSFLKLGMISRFLALKKVVVWIGQGGTWELKRSVQVQEGAGHVSVEAIGPDGEVEDQQRWFGISEDDAGWMLSEVARRVFLPGFADGYSSYKQLWEICEDREIELIWRGAWPASLNLEGGGETSKSRCTLVADFSMDFSDLLEPTFDGRYRFKRLRLGKYHEAPSS